MLASGRPELLDSRCLAGVDGRATLSTSPRLAFQPETGDITLKRMATSGMTRLWPGIDARRTAHLGEANGDLDLAIRAYNRLRGTTSGHELGRSNARSGYDWLFTDHPRALDLAASSDGAPNRRDASAPVNARGDRREPRTSHDR